MKVSGFTFIKNAIIYDYPIVESINSILPICDEIVVAVGDCDDNTRSFIENVDKQKIKIMDTVWDENLREGGKILAVETNKALQNISSDSDWCFYIQGDEVVHEKYLDVIYEAMKKYKDCKKIDGLLFNYIHFYGSYDYIGSSSNWYQNEIRVIKNNRSIYSYRDAQGFRKDNNQKLNVIPINAYIYHYGWVKKPDAMIKKQKHFNKFWHDDQWVSENIQKSLEFDYSKEVKALKLFDGSHPKVMYQRIKKKNWSFEFDISFNKISLRDKVKKIMAKYFGWKIGYKNYKIIKNL